MMRGVSKPDLPTRRYLTLIEQLGDELGRARGWKSAVARKLGVTPQYVNQLLSGKRDSVGHDVIKRAGERLGITPAFFFSEDAVDDRRANVPPAIGADPLIASAPLPVEWRDALQAASVFSRSVRERSPLETDAKGTRRMQREAKALLDALLAIPTLNAALRLKSAIDGTSGEGLATAGLLAAVTLQDEVRKVTMLARGRRSDAA